MPKRLLTVLLLALLMTAGIALSAQSGGIAGEWQMTRQTPFGGSQYLKLNLEVSGDKLTGTVTPGPVSIEGTFRNGVIDATLILPSPEGQRGKLTGTLRNGQLSGDGLIGGDPFTWIARRAPTPPPGGPRTHQFSATVFHNYFSSKIEPALHIFPVDSVETRTVDAGGIDEMGKRRANGGNPLTGPFFVEGATPGDTLVVKLTRVRLNRDSAASGDQISSGALGAGYYRNLKFDEKFESSWALDRTAGVARLAKPTDRLKDYTVPLRPMLGCIGVAPPQEMSFRSGFLGAWGGNLDYNELREGVTVYLPIYHPGALLFVGDGHAVQGDGELTGDALETSMDVSFTVDLIRGKSVPMPRAENEQFRMASGVDNSLQEALRQATTNLARWL